MIIRLAESLEVPIRERDALLLAAGFAPAYPQTRLGAPEREPIRTALERVLDGHLPDPAVVVEGHGDLVSANAAFHALTAGVAPHLLEPPVSVPRVPLHPQGLASRILNLDEWAWHVIDRIQADSAVADHSACWVVGCAGRAAGQALTAVRQTDGPAITRPSPGRSALCWARTLA
ncbi:hypothetical protein ACFYPA_32950 [Streptomyces sp. NPDC005775]|uniref:MmyB family transcriptional regulator n=1 Tax=unclassified Streptomyces TaxID=2593676 RepID=UPI0033DB46E0